MPRPKRASTYSSRSNDSKRRKSYVETDSDDEEEEKKMDVEVPDENELFIVEKLLDKKTVHGKVQYKVRWQGYTSDDDTWEPIENLESAIVAVEEYEMERSKAKKKVKKKDELSSKNGESHRVLCYDEDEVGGNEEIQEDENIDHDGGNDQLVIRQRRRTVTKKVNYFDDESGDEDLESFKDIENDKKKRSKIRSVLNKKTIENKRKSRAPSHKKMKAYDSESDEFVANSSSSSDDDDDAFSEDVDERVSFEEESDDDKKKKKASSSKSKAVTGSKASSEKSNAVAGSRKKNVDEDGADSGQSKMVDSFKPKNNPAEFFQPFVDAVGFDPTSGIVEGIVMAQVKKVGLLLLKAIEHGDMEPLRLQTACSGTDAPSIALSLVKECLDKLFEESNGNAKKGLRSEHNFQFEHVMSCEIEPFKQAYIGRNFPSTLLFPDICKLTEDEVVDVYGRATPVPKGNLFVAGTSCKDFSMQKATKRLDIEDKGQSGETFLAAVEFLETHQPQMAIFENVLNAPWDKMQEYITGRVPLKTIYSPHKGIRKDSKRGAPKALEFSISESNEYVVEIVPSQVGVRAGSIVEGFLKPGSKVIKKILASSRASVAKRISLDLVAKEHGINLKTDTLVFKKKCKYCTRLAKVDTKKYGLPQTRNRQYLFVWKSDDPEDDLGNYWAEIVKDLESPVKHSIDAFFLPSTHDRIRSFREALRSGPGLMVARERSREPYFWENVKHRDRAHNKSFRKNSGIEDESRPITSWDRGGRMKLAPSLWSELFPMWIGRILDMIDCFYIAAARDATPRDALHQSFTWNISQNVTREPFRTATPGVCGCVTPGGDLLVPHLGRTLLGFEKLLLQGIPFSRLLLGNETEVELSDLAGNAMSLPVVCATMLAAICAPQLRREKAARQTLNIKNFALSEKYDSSEGAVISSRGDLFGKERNNGTMTNAVDAFTTMLEHVDDAYRSSVLCICETSGCVSKSDKIMKCSGCGLSVCQRCCEKHLVQYHTMAENIDITRNGRVDPTEFERRLRGMVPAALCLASGTENILDDATSLESYSFQLLNVKRGKGSWSLLYGAVEDYGSGRQVAELRIELGLMGNLQGMGLCAYLKCFGPAIHETKPFRGKLLDQARLLMAKNSTGGDIVWEIRESLSGNNGKSSVKVVGSKEEPSFRAEIGINNDAAHSLKSHKHKLKNTLKTRNNLMYYHDKWKMWPGEITITGDKTGITNGHYKRLSCRQTIVQSALWCRETNESQDKLYIYIRPDVFRTSPDVAVIAKSPCYLDEAEVAELDDWIPENSLKENTHTTRINYVRWRKSSLRVNIALSTLKAVSPNRFSPQSEDEPILCEIRGLCQSTASRLCDKSSFSGSLPGDDNTEKENHLTLIGSGVAGTLTTKRFSTIAGPVLLKHAAEGQLPVSLANNDEAWVALPPKDGRPQYGKCDINVPLRPKEQWKKVNSKNFNYERVYDTEESKAYYMALLKRPKAWVVSVKPTSGTVTIRMNPTVPAHHAASALIHGRDVSDNIEVAFRLSELTSMAEADTEEFRVPNSNRYVETSVSNLIHPLYPRQAKALTRMINIEKEEVIYSEEERSEHVMPGIGWCLIARATRNTPLRGGVLADAIGSGKTVVTIALILADIEKARKTRCEEKGISGATLIVVPPGLIEQWDDERKKFTGDVLKCIQLNSTADLKRFSVRDFCRADIVIVPVSILEESKGKDRPYTMNLAQKAKTNDKIPSAPAYYSQREAPTIEGTWVPCANSIDPFVGNKGNQRRRDEAAYYTHCYSRAISKLRTKNFSSSEKGIPLEYFTWRRIIVDECHETLCTAKGEVTAESKKNSFSDRNRRGARELLGVAQTDARLRPLRATKCIWGLTGTPLLETEARVTELANLMGSTYVTGAAFHWRKEERESGRDIFLNHQEGSRSREYRRAIQASAQAYVRQAVQRNRGSKLHVDVESVMMKTNMVKVDGDLFNKVVKDSNGFEVSLEQLTDQELESVLEVTSTSEARGNALVKAIGEIMEKEPNTKIVIFADIRHGGHAAAVKALDSSGMKFAFIGEEENVKEQNEIVSWFRHVDVTDEDRKRPRILLLSFEQAAVHNLQHACHNVILFEPVYSGRDAVADASVEQQAIGRVVRQGQTHDVVTVILLVLKSPDGSNCIDDAIIMRNTDEHVLHAATSNFD